MKKTWCFIASIAICAAVTSQARGGTDGLAIVGGACHADAEVSGGGLDTEISIRPIGGISLVRSASPRAAVGLDVLYVQKGARASHVTYGLHYLVLSPHARVGISARGGSSPYLLLGAELGFLLSGTADVDVSRATDVVDVTDSFKRADVCGLLGFGFDVGGLNQPLFIEARYAHGLINIANLGMDWKTRTLSLLVGLQFGAEDAKPN